MFKKLDLVGKRFGKLTVVAKVEKTEANKSRYFLWDCICECGNTRAADTRVLTGGIVNRCEQCVYPTITFNGERKTIRQWSEKLNISADTIRNRLRRGLDVADVLNADYMYYKYLTVNGETLTISGWAKKLGISRQAVQQRLAAGWRIEDAVTLRPGER